VVRVVPDVPALGRELDYLLPAALRSTVRIGSVVRIPLHGRRVRGWVVALDSDPPAGVVLEELKKVTGLGPDPGTIELCRWVAGRWVGRLPTVLRLATPDRAVARASGVQARAPLEVPADEAVAKLLGSPGVSVLEVGPTEDPLPVAAAAAAMGQCLFVAPSARTLRRVNEGLRASSATVASWPEDFAGALAGHHVVGGRTAVFAPLVQLAAVVVWDEHDEGLQNESSPTWHARDVAVERARRAGVPCLLVSPCPSLEARAAAIRSTRRSGDRRRQGWAPLVVIDRRGEERSRVGLFSTAFVNAARDSIDRGERVVCVLNRTGRARLLACRGCGELATCESCDSAVRQPDETTLVCERCGAVRPVVCPRCGSTAVRVLRQGVTRAREDLEALLRRPVGLVSGPEGAERGGDLPDVLIGTEAVLHRVRRAGMVAFLDFDQELLAPRYRAAEEALALLVLASRAVGGRRNPHARVLVQTSLPDHEVVRAAVHADSTAVADAELLRRRLLGMPPEASLAAIGGEAAEEFVGRLGTPEGIEVQGPREGWWLARSQDPGLLAESLGSVKRPPGRLRLRVNPVRLP
jgi:primosomal protein N' (replication factor Y)